MFDTIYGYIGDGETYCDYCGDDTVDEPIFESNVSDLYGECCAICHSYFEPLNEEWLKPSELDCLRWANCPTCNHQCGYNTTHRLFSETRLQAIKGNLICHSCLKPMHF